MEEALSWARAAGITKVELEVFPHNAPAIALYRKLGFEEEGRRRNLYRIGGHHVDAVLMSIQLDEKLD
jgi:RimJ/RimL family protein N-acetyltransferase